MFWNGAKEKAQRAEVLEVTRRLVTTWAPEELVVLDVVADPFVAGRPILADGADGQDFGPEFFSAVSIALTFLVVAAKVQGVRLKPKVAVDPELAPAVERLVLLALGRPVPPDPGPPTEPSKVWERRVGRLLAGHFTKWEEWLDLCDLAGLDRSDLSDQEAPEAFWTEVIATLLARRACDELEALLQLAHERRPDDFALGSVAASTRVLCRGHGAPGGVAPSQGPT
jgi:hypothetical protein